MRWRGRRQSSNIEDRRGSGGRVVRRAGGGSILFVLIAIGASLLFGIDPRQVLGILEGGQTVSQRQTAPSGGRNDEGRAFVGVILADTEDVWNRVFSANNLKYEEPALVLFSGSARSACGFASAASGPFYCPGDRKVYIDLAFYEELRRRFKAPGDFAQAYVIAHEVGHHVQNLTGVLPEFNRRRQSLSEREANQLSVRVELQADCYAGVWAHFTQQKGLLEARRHRGGAERGAPDRRRRDSEAHAGLCGAGRFQSRLLGTARALVPARLVVGQGLGLRYPFPDGGSNATAASLPRGPRPAPGARRSSPRSCARGSS